ncbi:hypothetical protein J2T56_003252 [Natronobacillus azotifigens]|uniref:Uncharacterized protein n=1 Tax=Natronobacillus azotifigens TaxID=472978 RepID=A0A9J6RGE8_9BACI|nr:hypothetical protein [Natronobacillus azotifigens]MCZ0704647.1 hypothetical protein [Natronobacillus azotifigens]
MNQTGQQVRRNKEETGVDGVTVDQLTAYLALTCLNPYESAPY